MNNEQQHDPKRMSRAGARASLRLAIDHWIRSGEATNDQEALSLLRSHLGALHIHAAAVEELIYQMEPEQPQPHGTPGPGRTRAKALKNPYQWN